MERPLWLAQMERTVTACIPKHFTGHIQINCVDGGVGNTTLHIVYKPETPHERQPSRHN